MTAREQKRRDVLRLCGEEHAGLVREFFERMDEVYFERHEPDAIARHVSLAARLGTETLVALDIQTLECGRLEMTIVGFDYFGELAIVCGLLSSFELMIMAGDVHTYNVAAETTGKPKGNRQHRRSSNERSCDSRAKIVDVFRVYPIGGTLFDREKQLAFADELEALAGLLNENRYADARDRVNLRLVETLDRLWAGARETLYPVDVIFDDVETERWTIMEVHAQDTPAFLYTLANALSMRGVYIHRVALENFGTEIRDRFYIADRYGRKIGSQEEQAALRLAVGLIKQFTNYLPMAPDPRSALRQFDQLLDQILESGRDRQSILPLLERGLSDLPRILGSSRFLWEDFLRMQFENLAPILESLHGGVMRQGRELLAKRLEDALAAAPSFEDKKRTLNEFKDREMLAIDFHQLQAPTTDLVEFSRAVTELAETVVELACTTCDARLRGRYGAPRLQDGRACPLAVMGLGKLGGAEMGYASDVELLFVYEGAGRTDGNESIENAAYFDLLVRSFLEFIEAHRDGIFEIDLRLRPYGKKGPLASVIDSVAAYYREGGDAVPFERQAFVKLRGVAGDLDLRRKIEGLRDAFAYSGAPWDVAYARRLRWRQMTELVAAGERNVKQGAGGTLDIEYGVQYLQVQYGHSRPRLRTPNTVTAIERLVAERIVSLKEGERLRETYLFLRRVINALRMVRGNSRDLVLPATDSHEFKFLARRLGYQGADWKEAADRLAGDIDQHMKYAHSFYVSRFGEPKNLE